MDTSAFTTTTTTTTNIQTTTGTTSMTTGLAHSLDAGIALHLMKTTSTEQVQQQMSLKNFDFGGRHIHNRTYATAQTHINMHVFKCSWYNVP
jgi:hypothetical protein